MLLPTKGHPKAGALCPLRPLRMDLKIFWIPGIQGSIPELERPENLPASGDLSPRQLIASKCVLLERCFDRRGQADPWVGTKQAVGQRVIPLVWMKAAISASRS